MKNYLLVLLILLAGCQMGPPGGGPGEAARPYVVDMAPLVLWLETAQAYQELASTQAQQRLTEMPVSAEPLTQFKRALLFQQLGVKEGWINARDIFRTLALNPQLSSQQQYLAELFNRYNQALINSTQLQQDQLQKNQQVINLQQQVEELEQKVKALTNLEQSISNRKAQAIEE